MKKHKCFYCNRPAVFKLDDGKWCCRNTWQKCPSNTKAISKIQTARYYYWPKQTMERAIERGEIKCYICEEVANYAKMINKEGEKVEWGGCCSKPVKNCPGYSEYRSKILRKRYAENPDYKENISKAMLIAQNRPEVKQKKSESMKILHNEDCDKCVVFQENYTKSIKKRTEKATETRNDPEWKEWFSKVRTGVKYKTKKKE